MYDTFNFQAEHAEWPNAFVIVFLFIQFLSRRTSVKDTFSGFEKRGLAITRMVSAILCILREKKKIGTQNTPNSRMLS
jgi:hypothetical protein